MPRHITKARRGLIARLLAARWTYREIAARCKVGRGTVAQVAKERTRPELVPVGVAAMPVAEPEILIEHKTVGAYKCKCGYKVVTQPCIICEARRARELTRRRT
jgi:hypothetical protein